MLKFKAHHGIKLKDHTHYYVNECLLGLKAWSVKKDINKVKHVLKTKLAWKDLTDTKTKDKQQTRNKYAIMILNTE